MIASLADAWRWYESTRTVTLTMRQLGAKYWESLPWSGPLGQDERLRLLEADDVLRAATMMLDDLDDLCILVLFSVFEACVRQQVGAEVEQELASIKHPTLRYAAETAREGIAHGSFFRILEPYKAQDANLIEQVSLVRRYRNWVAHGRGGDQPAVVTPRMALERLEKFLDQFLPSATPQAGEPPL